MSREFNVKKFTKNKALTTKDMIKFLLPFEPTQKIIIDDNENNKSYQISQIYTDVDGNICIEIGKEIYRG